LFQRRLRINSNKNDGRRLTPEEKKLWELIARDASPLHPKQGEEPEEEDVEPPPARPLIRSYKDKKKPLPPVSPKIVEKSLVQGALADIDRNTAERFRRGDYPIDATLDLHGLTRDKAHRMLNFFILHHYERGSRCLLVITGKGSRGEEQRGVLREQLPKWLDQPELRPLILALATARPKHGGTGAFYVLLKRKRQSP
jgi:DNA-nicking Smr family endonuclease